MSNVLGQINVVSVDVSTWSGGVTLKREEIGVALPERAFTLGRKHLIAPERLAPFPTIRRRARERCLKVGSRFIGDTFALPADKQVMDNLVADLEAMRQEFDLKKAELLRDFGSAVDQWVAEPEVSPYEAMIRAAIPPISRVERQLQFGYTIFQVGAPETAPAANLGCQVAALGDTIFSEIAASARGLYEDFLERTVKVGVLKEEGAFTGAAIKSVRNLRQKLAGLSFVDDRIPPVVGEIDRALAGLPTQGRIEGAPMRELYSLLVILSDEERMLSFGRGLLAVRDVLQQEFGELIIPQAPQEESSQVDIEEAIAAEIASSESDEALFEDVALDHPPVMMPVLETRGIAIGF